MEYRWNDTDTGKPKNSEWNLSHRHFVHKNRKWNGLGWYRYLHDYNVLQHTTFIEDVNTRDKIKTLPFLLLICGIYLRVIIQN